MDLDTRPLRLILPTGSDAGPRTVSTRMPGTSVPPGLAPRPYLHPVRTLSGTALTAARPFDHPHHLGVSVAVSDVNGTNFWGGSTYVPGTGAAILPNHGRQVIAASDFSPSAPGTLNETIQWLAANGSLLAVEERRTAAAIHPDSRCWTLDLASVLRPAGATQQLAFSSSGAKGRTGAGYGGIFWRLPAGTEVLDVLTADGRGVDAAHGSLSPWLSLSLRIGSAVSSLVLHQAEDVHPWFIRTAGYTGVGPAVAWSRARVIGPSTPLRLALTAVLVDGAVAGTEEVIQLIDQKVSVRF